MADRNLNSLLMPSASVDATEKTAQAVENPSMASEDEIEGCKEERPP